MRRGVLILAILWLSGPVFGQAPVGRSTGILGGSRLGLSFDYGQANPEIVFGVDGGDKERLDFQTAFATFSAALTSRWEFFVRVGGAQAETTGFDGGWNVSWGLGTRATLLRWRDLSWGGLVQFTNLVSRFDTMEEFSIDGTPTLLNATDELNLGEYVLATGPTWQQGPLTLYGGLLLRYADGEFEILAGRLGDQFDVDARWDFGGYLGAGVTLFERDPAHTWGFSRCTLTAEGRFTGDSAGFSVGVLLPFGGEY